MLKMHGAWRDNWDALGDEKWEVWEECGSS